MKISFSSQIEALQFALSNIQFDELELLKNECVDKLKHGNKIVFSGLGKNAPICQKVVGTINSFSIEALFIHSSDAAHGSCGAIGSNDIVILLSKSGKTKEIEQIIDFCSTKNISIWLITFNEELLKKSDKNIKYITLPNVDEGDGFNLAPINTTIVSLCTLQALAVGIIELMGKNSDDYILNHPKNKNNYLKK